MKAKEINSSKQNFKRTQARLSLNLPLSCRKNLNSGRLSIPNRKENTSRPSISSIHSRPSLPISTHSSRTYELPYKKQHIIENLMNKLDDEEELRAIIQAKYLGNEHFSSLRLSLNSQGTISRCSNCTQNKTTIQNRPFNPKYQQMKKQQKKYLQQKLRDCPQQMVFMKHSVAQLSQNTVFLNKAATYTNKDNRFIQRKSLGSFRKKQIGIQSQNKQQIDSLNSRDYLIEQKQNKNTIIKDSFLSHLDSTLNILGNASASRVR